MCARAAGKQGVLIRVATAVVVNPRLSAAAAGFFQLGERPAARLGYSAMQLGGPNAMGRQPEHELLAGGLQGFEAAGSTGGAARPLHREHECLVGTKRLVMIDAMFDLRTSRIASRLGDTEFESLGLRCLCR